MGRRNYKKGITLIEILITFLIFSFLSIISYFVIGRMYELNKKNQLVIDEAIIIQNTYELFNIDPINFKDNLITIYDGRWENEYFYISNEENLIIKYENGYELISVYIIKNNEVHETWKRKKGIQF